MSGFGKTSHENVIKPCRALSCRYPGNCVAVWPRRSGNVANRNGLRHPASQHHSHSAEAGGKATEAGSNAAKARSGGKHSCISPDIATRPSPIGTANRSKTGGCERFSNGEICRD
jgi:hypothetical protein